MFSFWIKKLSWTKFDKVHKASYCSFNFGVEDLKNSLFFNRIFNHFSNLNFFDWFDNNIKLIVLTSLSEFSLEDSWFAEILKTPNHGSTWNDIFDFLPELFVDVFVDGSVKSGTIWRDIRSCLDDKLINDIVFLIKADFIKIGEEVNRVGVFELGPVLTVSPGENLNGFFFHKCQSNKYYNFWLDY